MSLLMLSDSNSPKNSSKSENPLSHLDQMKDTIINLENKINGLIALVNEHFEEMEILRTTKAPSRPKSH